MHQATKPPTRSRPTVRQRIETLTSFPVADRAKLADLVMRCLADRSWDVRFSALKIAIDENLLEVEDSVVGLLADNTSLVRGRAVECIGSFHEGEAIEAERLYPLLRDKDWVIRTNALESLARVGDTSALPRIAELLEDDQPVVRSYAANAVEDLDGEIYVEEIEHALRIETDERAKTGFAGALFYFGDAGKFSILLGLLESKDYRVRCASANTIESYELTDEQLHAALAAVSLARIRFLYRADQSTMEVVEKSLRKDFDRRHSGSG